MQHPLVMRKVDGKNLVSTLEEVDDANLLQRCQQRLGLLYT